MHKLEVVQPLVVDLDLPDDAQARPVCEEDIQLEVPIPVRRHLRRREAVLDAADGQVAIAPLGEPPQHLQWRGRRDVNYY